MPFDRVGTATRAAAANPRLLGWSALVALLDATSLVVLLALVSGRSLPVVLAALVFHRFVLAVVLSITLPGSYALYRAGVDPAFDGRSRRGTLRIAGRTIRDANPHLLASSLLTRAIALLAAVAVAAVVGALFLGVDTVAVWTTALLDVSVDRAILAVTAVLATGAAGAWLANGTLAYQDLLVVDGESRPRRAWLDSAVATTARPLRLVSESLLRGLLLAAPWVAGFVTLLGLAAVTSPPGTETPAPFVIVASAVVFLALAALARATVVAYHVESYEGRIRDRVAGGPSPATRDHPLGNRPRRVAIAALVVLAAVAGVAAVRTGDLAPGPDVPDAELRPSDADATVSTAIERTMNQDFAFEFANAGYNRTTEEWRTVFDGAGRIDRDGREARVSIALHFDDEVDRRLHYGADGIYAIRVPAGRIRTNHPLETRMGSGNWTAAIGRPFAATAGDLEVLPAESEGWHRVGSDGDTVTYALDDLQDLGDVDLSLSAPNPSNEDVEVLNGTGARIVIDRDTATVRRFEVLSHFRETDDPEEPRVVSQRTTLVITDVGDVTVERPGDLHGPGPIEVLWDVVFYA